MTDFHAQQPAYEPGAPSTGEVELTPEQQAKLAELEAQVARKQVRADRFYREAPPPIDASVPTGRFLTNAARPIMQPDSPYSEDTRAMVEKELHDMEACRRILRRLAVGGEAFEGDEGHAEIRRQAHDLAAEIDSYLKFAIGA